MKVNLVLYPGYQKFHPNFYSFLDERPACSESPMAHKLKCVKYFYIGRLHKLFVTSIV